MHGFERQMLAAAGGHPRTSAYDPNHDMHKGTITLDGQVHIWPVHEEDHGEYAPHHIDMGHDGKDFVLADGQIYHSPYDHLDPDDPSLTTEQAELQRFLMSPMTDEEKQRIYDATQHTPAEGNPYGHAKGVLDRLSATPQYMYHVAPSSKREQIMSQGLLPGQSGGTTVEGEWADNIYGQRPIYLSHQPGRSADIDYGFPNDHDVWKVDVSGHPLTADLPGLVDTGAYIGDGDGVWWDTDEETPPAFLPHMDENQMIPFDAMMNELAPAAIDRTQTAATTEPIGPERLTLHQPAPRA